MEAAHADHEVRVVAERDQQTHLAFDGQEDDARLEQRGEEPEPLLVELDRADEVDLQNDQRDLLGRDGDFEHAEDARCCRESR